MIRKAPNGLRVNQNSLESDEWLRGQRAAGKTPNGEEGVLWGSQPICGCYTHDSGLLGTQKDIELHPYLCNVQRWPWRR